jgi:hypothetical protein
MTCEALAQRATVHERYLREWLSLNVASGYVLYDPENRRFSLPPEQTMIFVDMGPFDLMVAVQKNQGKVQHA